MFKNEVIMIDIAFPKIGSYVIVDRNENIKFSSIYLQECINFLADGIRSPPFPIEFIGKHRKVCTYRKKDGVFQILKLEG